MSYKWLKPEEIFKCRKCGDCCKGFGGTYVSAEDIKAIANFINTDKALFLKKYCRLSGTKFVLAQAKNGFCVFSENNICSIHPVKPRMCKAWPFIPGVLNDPGNWTIMAGFCPGINENVSKENLLECVRGEIAKSQISTQVTNDIIIKSGY